MNWLKTTALTATFAVTMVLSGCGEDSPQGCKYQVQQNLDKGDFDKVVTELNKSDSVCYGEGGYTKNEGSYNLAAAYLGQAGWTVPALINIVSDLTTLGDGNVSADTLTKLDSLFKLFKGPEADAAAREYQKIILSSGKSCDSPTSEIALACSLKDVNNSSIVLDPLLGKAGIDANYLQKAQAGVKISNSLGDVGPDLVNDILTPPKPGSAGDVNDNNRSDLVEVETCAAKDANVTGDGNCSNESTISFQSYSPVTFTTKAGNNVNFTLRIFTVDDNDSTPGDQNYTRLIDTSRSFPSPAKTVGKCFENFDACPEENATIPYTSGACYACPDVSEEGNVTSSNDGIKDILNGPDSTVFEGVLPDDVNLSEYDDNASDNNSTPIVEYFRSKDPDNNNTGPLSDEEMALFFEYMK